MSMAISGGRRLLRKICLQTSAETLWRGRQPYYGKPDSQQQIRLTGARTMAAGGDKHAVFMEILLQYLVNARESQFDKALALADHGGESSERLARLYEDVKFANVDSNKKRKVVLCPDVQMTRTRVVPPTARNSRGLP